MSSYTRGKTLGEGTFGIVFEAFHSKNGNKVAIKRIKSSKNKVEGAVVTALREIKHMQALKHPNVLHLYEAYTADECIHMVLEFCPIDLENIINNKKLFLKEDQIRKYMEMTISGMKYCHDNFILHRDLKPSNLLIGLNGQIRIADFGLAKSYPTSGNMTPTVVTIWYRAPELLFGARHYSAAVDVWAIGCIFAELMIRRPIFQAMSDSNIEQLQKIFNVMGTPTENTWPNVKLLPQYVEFEKREPLSLVELIVDKCRQSQEAHDMLASFLLHDPRKRCTLTDALKLPYMLKNIPPNLEMPHDVAIESAGGSSSSSSSKDDDQRDKKRIRR